MPVQATTTLPPPSNAVADRTVRTELRLSWEDTTNYGDFRAQIRELGSSEWNQNAPGFAEQTIESDANLTGTKQVIFTGLDIDRLYEARVRGETEHRTSEWVSPSGTDAFNIVDNWPYDFQYVQEGSKLWRYLSTYASEIQTINANIEDLYEERFLESATTVELEKLAREVGITRRDGEGDESLRFRAILRKSVAASDGTADDIEEILTLAFGEEELVDIDVSHASGRPVTQFSVPQEQLDEIPLTRAEIESELERAFPAGFGVTVTTTDTWILGESGAQGLGNGGLI